jgi:hypothetical protein
VANWTVEGPSNLGLIVHGVRGLLSTSNPMIQPDDETFSESQFDIVKGELVQTAGMALPWQPP